MAKVPLSGSHSHMFIIVDEVDEWRVRNWEWYVLKAKGSKTFYARSQRAFYIHQFVLGYPPKPGLQIDHINGNGLDNRRCNLRWVTPAENMAAARSMHGPTSAHGVHTVTKPNGKKYHYCRATRCRLSEAEAERIRNMADAVT